MSYGWTVYIELWLDVWAFKVFVVVVVVVVVVIGVIGFVLCFLWVGLINKTSFVARAPSLQINIL